MSAAEGAFDVLVVGFDKSLQDLLAPKISPLKIKHLATATEVEQFLEGFELSAGTSVLISHYLEGMSHLEVAQALSSYFQGLLLYFITIDRTKFELEPLKKNGFADSFILPIDSKLLETCIEEIKHKKTGGGAKKYKAVKLVDVSAGEELPFEVRTYLPLNKKYVSLTGSGALTENKVKILKEKSVNSVFVDTTQVDKFYDYAAEKLIKAGLSSNDAVSQTEKAEKMQSSVRGLFRSILDSTNGVSDFDTGRDILDQSKKIVESYVSKKTGVDLKEKLKSLVGEGADAYSHSQIVSTMACLFSMATGIGQPEDLAIAGLFHDLGIVGFSREVSIFDYQELPEEDKKRYMMHPRISLNMLKEKKVTVTQKIADIIERHHERMDGKGFPDQLQAHKIPLEAQLLAYTDAFEYLTRIKPGMPMPKMSDVHNKITQTLSLSPDVVVPLSKFINTL